ncbi:hypothetical protein AXA44_47880 [Rhodococcus sp. SC4]|nr:hypothetical protein AXA44_47880 [Rhodococcus sp. SC4]
MFPDWPSIAQEWDAVHVSLSGLLCAEPLISQVPYTGGDTTGYTHCHSGPYVGVAEWAVPSTAWLRPSAHMTVEQTAPAAEAQGERRPITSIGEVGNRCLRQFNYRS